MPMFFVTFMVLIFWIVTSLTIQIVCGPFRWRNIGLRLASCCRVLERLLAISIRWIRKVQAKPGAVIVRSGERILPRSNANYMVNFLQTLTVAAEVIVGLRPKQSGFGKGGILPQSLIAILERLLELALIQEYSGSKRSRQGKK